MLFNIDVILNHTYDRIAKLDTEKLDDYNKRLSVCAAPLGICFEVNYFRRIKNRMRNSYGQVRRVC